MTVVVGAGGIGQAIARRISSGRHILVANHSQQSADAAAHLLEDAGVPTTAMHADVSDRAMVQAGKVDSCLAPAERAALRGLTGIW